eukprot:scaffold1326_cov51-Cyclotella_meneghiniana.AAC.2
MRPAADPPIKVDAVVANASLLEMDESGAENADTPNGVSVAIVKTERRTMIHSMGDMDYYGCGMWDVGCGCVWRVAACCHVRTHT